MNIQEIILLALLVRYAMQHVMCQHMLYGVFCYLPVAAIYAIYIKKCT